ncbi:MAG: NAD(P)-binding protein [Gammaproteobacteria bacterium]|nr:NAD(P)-binding protein [Gammaproteobacteria bacterium]MDH3446711.1 NAD(P)-binding protein [Gammaproteobacteria bacterium]
MKRIAVIGAGIAGLTLARELRGLAEVEVFEKSRGSGGRMATRRADPYQFDHGAQFFSARSENFERFLEPLIDAGDVARWDADFVEIDSGGIVSERSWRDGPAHYVAVPGMSALSKRMAEGLAVTLETQITLIIREGLRWRLLDQNQASRGGFDWVISAIPAQQARALLPETFAPYAALAGRRMLGCYSLMLGFAKPLDIGWQAAFVGGADISWISNDNSKPGRPDSYTLLVHSTNRWAEENIEAEADWVSAYLLAELARVIRYDLPPADHSALHRWRYANIEKQAGARYYLDREQRLAAIGDWCIQGRVESAYQSAFELALELNTLI